MSPPEVPWLSIRKQKGQQKPAKEKTPEPPKEDLLRVDLRVGEIVSAEKHPNADSLYIEQIDVGDEGGKPRQIISGLANHVPLESLVGRKVVVICNLKPSKMRGVESEGMILAASAPREDGEGEVVELVAPPSDAIPGEIIKVAGFDEPRPDAMLKSKSQQEVWKRVQAQLKSTGDLKAAYDGKALETPTGPCTVPTLKDAAIR